MRSYTFTALDNPDGRLGLSSIFLEYIKDSLKEECKKDTYFQASCLIIRRDDPLAAILQKLAFEQHKTTNYIFPNEVITHYPERRGGLAGFFLGNPQLISQLNADPNAPTGFKFCLAPLQFQLAHLRHLFYQDQITLGEPTFALSNNKIVIPYRNQDLSSPGTNSFQAKLELDVDQATADQYIKQLNNYFRTPEINAPILDYTELNVMDEAGDPVEVLAMKLDNSPTKQTSQKKGKERKEMGEIISSGEDTNTPPQLIIANMDFVTQAHLPDFPKKSKYFYKIANPKSKLCALNVKRWSAQLVTETSYAATKITDKSVCGVVLVGINFEPIVITLEENDILAFLQLISMANYQFTLPDKWKTQLRKKETQTREEAANILLQLDSFGISVSKQQAKNLTYITSLSALRDLKNIINSAEEKLIELEMKGGDTASKLHSYFLSFRKTHLGLLLHMATALSEKGVFPNFARSSLEIKTHTETDSLKPANPEVTRKLNFNSSEHLENRQHPREMETGQSSSETVIFASDSSTAPTTSKPLTSTQMPTPRGSASILKSEASPKPSNAPPRRFLEPPLPQKVNNDCDDSDRDSPSSSPSRNL